MKRILASVLSLLFFVVVKYRRGTENVYCREKTCMKRIEPNQWVVVVADRSSKAVDAENWQRNLGKHSLFRPVAATSKLPAVEAEGQHQPVSPHIVSAARATAQGP